MLVDINYLYHFCPCSSLVGVNTFAVLLEVTSLENLVQEYVRVHVSRFMIRIRDLIIRVMERRRQKIIIGQTWTIDALEIYCSFMGLWDLPAKPVTGMVCVCSFKELLIYGSVREGHRPAYILYLYDWLYIRIHIINGYVRTKNLTAGVRMRANQ